MNTRTVLGVVGGVICVIGVFAPIITIPIMGSQSYFQNGRGDGTIVLLLGISTIIATLTGRYRWNWISGFGSLGLIGFMFIRFQQAIRTATSEMQAELAGNPFAGLAEIAVQSVQLSWGLPLLVSGAILTIASAAKRRITASDAIGDN